MESATSTPEPQETAPQDHEAAMMAVADAQEALGQNDANIPVDSKEGDTQEELILGKFKTQEDLIKAYSELEGKLGGKQDPQQDQPPIETDPQQEEAQQTAEEVVTSKGLDYAKLEAEVAQNGQLSLESLALLSGAGITNEAAQNYVSNVLSQQKAVDESFNKIAFDVAGSEESYTTLLTWAEENLDNSQKQVFNHANNSNNPALFQQAVQSLMFQMESSYGSDPAVRIGGKTSRPTQQGLNSEGSIVSAMSDPRWLSDSSYRREVEQKLINGDQFR